MSDTNFGRYEVRGVLGQGAMGKVYDGYDPLTQRRVAIKALKDDILSQDETGEFRQRFQREARAAGGLSHPNIITVFDVGENYFVMEFLEGESLLSMIAARGAMPLKDVLPLVSPIADALDYAHGKGVYHRDVKPANIMVTPEGRPVITDFGLAHLESTAMTAAGQFLGSPSYMAPEQVIGSDITPRADLYSLSVVTYEMLTGNKPFPGDNVTSVIYKVVHSPPISPTEVRPELPKEYADIFLRALAKEPPRRFESFSEFVAALNLETFVPLEEPPVEGEPTIVSYRQGPRVDGDDATTVQPDGDAEGAEQETAELPVPGQAALASASATTRAGVAESPESPVDRTTLAGVPRNALIAGAVALLVIAALFVPGLLSDPMATGLLMETDPDGAEVWVDDALVGTSPVELASLSFGNHDIRVTKDGFLPLEERLELVEGEPVEPFFFALQPTRISLFLESEPGDAAVTIDGEAVGSTPLEDIELEPGQHEVEVALRGYETWRSAVVAQAGETVDLVARLRVARRAPPAPKQPAPVAEAAPAAPEPAPEPEPEPEHLPEPPEPEVPQLGELIVLGPDDKPAEKLSGKSPSYPPLARKLNQQGRVMIGFILTEDGVPTELEVLESASPVLDQAVLDAVAKWRYAPAERLGVRVRIKMRVRQTFRLGR